MSDQSEREALERAATALWKEKRGTSSRPFEWEDSRQWWEEDARIVIDAHRTALAAREEPPAAEPEAEMVWGEGPYEQGEDTEQPDALSESAPRKGPHAPKGAKLALLGIDDAITCRASG